MDAQVKDVVRELTLASDEARIAFPEVVLRLVENGVERYHADLVLGTRTYFMPDASNEVTQGEAVATAPAAEFAADAIVAALRAIQRKEISYRGFCDRVAAAGCVGYLVSVSGRSALYYGRGNEVYVERFPDARP